MSIFSRFRKRGEEDQAAAEPAPREPAPKIPPTPAAAPHARPPEAAKSRATATEAAPSPRAVPREIPAPPSSPPPPRGNIQAAVAGMIAQSGAPSSARAPIAATRAAPVSAPPPAPSPPEMTIELVVDDDSASNAAPAPAAAPAHGTSTESDEAALRETFEELTVSHVIPIRNAMMEVRFGEGQASWLELGRPALKSLRTMATEIGHSALVAALDQFVGALQTVLEPGQPPEVTGTARDTLLAAYAPLATCLPRAFALEGERDRREPIVVRALLEQVPGLEPLMIDKLGAAGLGTLAQLFAAKADEIAAVTGLPETIAAAVASRIQAFRRATPGALTTVDPPATVRELARLQKQLRADQTAFEEAARGWTENDRQAKRHQRQRRQATFLQITIALVRLGEIDFALRLPKLPFARRIDELDRVLVSRASALRVELDADSDNGADAGLHSGPHPAAA